MGYPVDSRWTSRVAGSTPISAGWANATDDAVVGLYGMGRTVVGLVIDGQGYQSGAPSSGSLVIKGSGNAFVGGNVIANNLVASGSATVYGTVLANKHMTDGGGTGLEMRSGTTVLAYERADMLQTLSGGLWDVLSIPVVSGKAAEITVRAAGRRAASGLWVTHTVAAGCSSLGGNLDGGTNTTLHYDAKPTSGVQVVQIATSSGQATVQVLGLSGQTVNWSTHTTVALV